MSSKANDHKPALFNGRNLFLKLRLFLSSLCATSSSVWVKVTALVHTHLLWSGFKALCRSSWGEAYVFFLLGIQWCTSSRIWLVLFYFRCTVPMRDKEGKQDYRYFFFLNEVTFSRTENLLHISYAVSVKSLWSGVMCGETFLPAGRNLSESISVWEVHI